MRYWLGVLLALNDERPIQRLLWGVLLAGVGLLATLVLRLVRDDT